MADDAEIQTLRDDFRHHLEVFYAALKLAPPYHSVEKAVTHLTAALKAMAPDERARLAARPDLKWTTFGEAFVGSGLHLKHRGIIAGLAKAGGTALPAEYQVFLKAFLP